MTNVTGDMSAETTNGDIVVENAQDVDPRGLDGERRRHIQRHGARQRRLSATTHSGDIRVGLGGAANATVFVRTFQGDFSSDLPIELPAGQWGQRQQALQLHAG